MITVFIRSTLLYICLLIALRVMGKGEIAEMNTFDLVITILLAEVASIPMENNNIPLLYGIASITALTFMQTFISFLSLKNRKLSSVLSGHPSILINKGVIDVAQLKKDRISIDELLETLRSSGFFNIKDVQYAILESDGSLSILPSPKYQQVPKSYYDHIPISVIIDGSIIKDSLSKINKDIIWLMNELKRHGVDNAADILICVVDENNKVFIQKK